MISPVQMALSVGAMVLYIALMLGYQWWLWKIGTDRFRQWLEKQLGYPIKLVAGFRSMAWETTPEAPPRVKWCLLLASTAFLLLAGLVPIFILGVVTLLLFVLQGG